MSKLPEMFIATQDSDTHRICGMCGQLKEFSAFYKDGKDCNGNVKYRRDCKDCYKRTRMLESRGGK